MLAKLIAITGGPCAGKSTVLSFLKEKLTDYGWEVYTTKEAATQLMEQGVPIEKVMVENDPQKVVFYQTMIARVTMQNEANMLQTAEMERGKAVILCDRGAIDIRAYLPEGKTGDEQYESILKSCKTSKQSIAEMYNGVIKLTTAADGAEEHYTTANNLTRKEGIDEARYLDRRIEHAYLDNSELFVRVIDNSTGFEEKKLRTLAAVCALLAIPVPLEIERKYHIDTPHDLRNLGPFRTSGIEQTYLLSPDPQKEIRVRKRTRNGVPSHYLTRKRRIAPGKNEEEEEIISATAYEQLLLERDPHRKTIYKTRHCFFYQGQFLELDEFHNLGHPLWMLEVERTDADRREPILPSSLDVIKEVTDDPEYSNHALALHAL